MAAGKASPATTLVDRPGFYERVWLQPPHATSWRGLLTVTHAGYSRWASGGADVRRSSAFFALELVTAGNIVLNQSGHETVVEAGEVFVLRKGMNHEYRTGSAGFAHKCFIGVDGAILDVVLSDLQLSDQDSYRLEDPRAIRALIRRACTLLSADPARVTLQLSMLATQVLVELANGRCRSGLPAPVQAVLEFMGRNLGKPVGMEDLCAAANLSATHLTRMFGRTLGVSPIRYLLGLRVRHAQHLLSHTSLPVKQIAALLGYSEPAYFANQFRTQTGMSPSSWRAGQR